MQHAGRTVWYSLYVAPTIVSDQGPPQQQKQQKQQKTYRQQLNNWIATEYTMSFNQIKTQN